MTANEVEPEAGGAVGDDELARLYAFLSGQEVTAAEARAYRERSGSRRPPLDCTPLTTGPQELAARLVDVYGNAPSRKQVAGWVVSANPDVFPRDRTED